MSKTEPIGHVWRALSVRQPFASLIMAAVKNYEYRTWAPSSLGLLAIHASQAHPGPVVLKRRAIALAMDEASLAVERLPTSQILGSVYVTDVLDGSFAMRKISKKQRLLCTDDGDVECGFLWHMTDPIAFRTAKAALVMKGALNLWPVPNEVSIRLNRQSRDWS